jgi:hypothetical protein
MAAEATTTRGGQCQSTSLLTMAVKVSFAAEFERAKAGT